MFTIRSVCLPGEQYGRLKVISEGEKRKNGRHVLTECVCGTRKEISVHALRAGHTQSCGCLQKERSGITHGGSKTHLYRIWRHMRERCNNPSAKDYIHYGGRGIKVWPAWQHFEGFRNWALENGYESNLSIDRKDNNKGYSPSNCRWASQSQQCRNKRPIGNKSGYVGVYPTGWLRWYAASKVNGRQIRLGTFDDPFSAAWVRDEFSKGIDEYATTNNLIDRRKKQRPVKIERRGTFIRRSL